MEWPNFKKTQNVHLFGTSLDSYFTSQRIESRYQNIIISQRNFSLQSMSEAL